MDNDHDNGQDHQSGDRFTAGGREDGRPEGGLEDGQGEDERLAALVEELDDTDAILERVRRRGIPEDIAHQLRPRRVPRGGDPTPPATGA